MFTHGQEYEMCLIKYLYHLLIICCYIVLLMFTFSDFVIEYRGNIDAFIHWWFVDLLSEMNKCTVVYYRCIRYHMDLVLDVLGFFCIIAADVFFEWPTEQVKYMMWTHWMITGVFADKEWDGQNNKKIPRDLWWKSEYNINCVVMHVLFRFCFTNQYWNSDWMLF